MTQPTARMMLACKHDGERWPDDTPMEAVLLHFQVEHDTDAGTLELIVVCSPADCRPVRSAKSLAGQPIRDMTVPGWSRHDAKSRKSLNVHPANNPRRSPSERR